MININKKPGLNIPPFYLPPEITFTTELTNNKKGSYIFYIFRHKEYGELGRLIVKEENKGECHISCHVVGDIDDPMTAKRRLLIDPVFSYFAKIFKMTGAKEEEYKLDKSYFPSCIIKTKCLSCEKCGVNVAMLIYAPDAYTADQLEDYARLMYKKVNEMRVPTWVLGAQEGTFRQHKRKALVLKLFPEKETSREMGSTELFPILDGCG